MWRASTGTTAGSNVGPGNTFGETMPRPALGGLGPSHWDIGRQTREVLRVTTIFSSSF